MLLLVSFQAYTSYALVSDKPYEEWKKTHANGIAAIVGPEVITMDRIRRDIEPLVPKIQQESKNAEEFKVRIEKTGHEAMERLIEKKLIVMDFKKKKFQVPDSYFNNEFNDTIRREFKGDLSLFHQYLTANSMNESQFKKELNESIISNFMQSDFKRSQAEVSPEKIKKYYEDNKRRFQQEETVHLKLIKLSPLTNESQDLLTQEANKIIADLKNGANFNELALKHSQDDTKNTGGDWGWIKKDEIKKELETHIFALKKGEYSAPINIDENIYILFAQDKKEAGYTPLSEIRKEIEMTLAAKITREERKKWTQKLRKKTYIKYYY